MIELLRENRMTMALMREVREVVRGTAEEIVAIDLVSDRDPMSTCFRYGLFSSDARAFVGRVSIRERDLQSATHGEAGAIGLIVHHVLMMAIALTSNPHEHTGERRHGDWEY